MIRPARPADVDAILGLIRELAAYENLAEQIDVSAAKLHQDLFEPPPACESLVAADTKDPAAPLLGYALFFPTYSSFKTRRCLYLEDLYVTPAARGKGHGKALLAAVAQLARSRDCRRVDWSVLAWNRAAIEFYQEMGAALLPDWRACRLEDESLARVAALADRIG